MMIVEKMLERRIQEVVNVDKLLFSFMLGRGRLKHCLLSEAYKDKKRKLYTSVLWISRRYFIEFRER